MDNTFIKLMTNKLKGKGLNLTDKAVYSSLYTKFQYHNNQPFYTYESFIADELEISEKTVSRTITKLQNLGLVDVVRKFNNETKKTVNFYIVNEPDTTKIQADVEDEISEVINISMEEVSKPEMEINQLPQVSQLPWSEEETEDIEDVVKEEVNKEVVEEEPVVEPTEEIQNYGDYKFNSIARVIKENFDKTPEEYFSSINQLADIKFNVLLELSEASSTNPQVALDFIKEIRNIA